MELRHLRYFVAVAEELSFSRAALRLHIAQPPLSLQIRHLEEELGLTLFERGSRPLRLTESGRFFQTQAVELLAKLDAAVAGTQRIGRGHAGWLGIGFVSSAMNMVMPPVLRRFRAEFPDVEVLLLEMLQNEQAAALRDHRIHVGFVRPSLGETEFVEERLYDEPLMVAVPSDHRLVGRKCIALDDLAEEPIVLYGGRTAGGLNDHYILSVFRASGIEPKIGVEVRHAESALGLVAAGLGLSLTAASFANSPRAGVHFLPVTGVKPCLAMRIAYRAGESSPVVKAFLKIVREETLLFQAGPQTRLAS